MSDSENVPTSHPRTKRRSNEVDTSNMLPANTKKQRTSTPKKKAVEKDKAETEIKKIAKQLKQMKRALKASNSPAQPKEDHIEDFESEEEDDEEISSFPKHVRHIDTTLPASRGIVPAGRHHRALITMSNISAGTGSDDDNRGNGDYSGSNNHDNQVFGSPTTGTTSPTPPYSMERDNTEEMSPMRTEIELPQVAGWNNNVPPIGGRGPRARDYTDEVYRLILKACLRYEIFIVTEQAFPDANEQTQAAHTFFKEACEDMGNNYQVTDRITGIIKARGSRIRGSIKSTARFFLPQVHKFLSNPVGQKGKDRNKILAAKLLDGDLFHCSYEDGPCFEHSLIFKIFSQVFFGNKKSSIGVAYADHFNPLPLQTMALILGFCIRLYLADGIVGDQPFSESAVKPSYDAYLAELKEWSAIEPAVTESIRRKQFKKAIRGAGASVQKVTGMSKEAKLRARTNLVGREVDTASESEYDRGAQSEEL
ncbi:hypothetical protein FIBSPDRAFT_1049856 [Athelia psychrophila]|uniref:DUF6532 domain-containing protein n=1 Tax=Athelia psychrophila TaxID=1759441 RepID=A0A166BN65_9AGAM|nr:hypothetical protein FIBSPDRAFT_1049856 [Fibularhizoctonia sp. CBS 109695]